MLPFVTEAWQIYVLVFILQSASATFTPAFQSIIPSTLPDENDYTRALTLSRLAYDLESLLSPMIAAALLTVVSHNSFFVGTAIRFSGSALLVLATRLPEQADASVDLPFRRKLPLSAHIFIRTPSLRFLLATNLVVAGGSAIVLVNSVVYARGLCQLDSSALALALACYGTGSLVGALAIPKLVARFRVVPVMLGGAAMILLGLLAAILMTPIAAAGGTAWIFLLCVWTVLGMGTSLVNTPSSRLLAAASTPSNRNLVYTAQFALSHACFLITYPIAGWLGTSSLTLAATTLAVIALIGLVAGIPLARRTLAESEVAASN